MGAAAATCSLIMLLQLLSQMQHAGYGHYQVEWQQKARGSSAPVAAKVFSYSRTRAWKLQALLK